METAFRNLSAIRLRTGVGGAYSSTQRSDHLSLPKSHCLPRAGFFYIHLLASRPRHTQITCKNEPPLRRHPRNWLTLTLNGRIVKMSNLKNKKKQQTETNQTKKVNKQSLMLCLSKFLFQLAKTIIKISTITDKYCYIKCTISHAETSTNLGYTYVGFQIKKKKQNELNVKPYTKCLLGWNFNTHILHDQKSTKNPNKTKLV